MRRRRCRARRAAVAAAAARRRPAAPPRARPGDRPRRGSRARDGSGGSARIGLDVHCPPPVRRWAVRRREGVEARSAAVRTRQDRGSTIRNELARDEHRARRPRCPPCGRVPGLPVARARPGASCRRSARTARCSASPTSRARSTSTRAPRTATSPRSPALGYLQQDADTRKYRLGPRVVDLGFAAINSMEITRVAGRHAAGAVRRDRLHRQHGGARRRRHRLRRPAPQRPRAASSASTSTCTSARGCRPTARRWARCCSRTSRRSRCARCSTGSTSPAAGRTRSPRASSCSARWPQVRQSGIAVNDEELAPGLRSIAAPIRDRSGSRGRRGQHRRAPDDRGTPRSSRSLAGSSAPLRRTTADISTRMGYRAGERLVASVPTIGTHVLVD